MKKTIKRKKYENAKVHFLSNPVYTLILFFYFHLYFLISENCLGPLADKFWSLSLYLSISSINIFFYQYLWLTQVTNSHASSHFSNARCFMFRLKIVKSRERGTDSESFSIKLFIQNIYIDDTHMVSCNISHCDEYIYWRYLKIS